MKQNAPNYVVALAVKIQKVKNDVNNEDKKDNIIKEENINEKNEIKNNSNEKKEENK